jgi:uncharacterized membrane protein (UPF0127 family)
MIVNIGKKKFKVKTVVSKKDTVNGMMNKKFNNEFNGMLFIMNEGEHCFWMKNCVIPLDIIFIEDGKISEIYHNCPPCKTEECSNYCGEGDFILEIKGGTSKKYGFKIGDLVNV